MGLPHLLSVIMVAQRSLSSEALAISDLNQVFGLTQFGVGGREELLIGGGYGEEFGMWALPLSSFAFGLGLVAWLTAGGGFLSEGGGILARWIPALGFGHYLLLDIIHFASNLVEELSLGG